MDSILSLLELWLYVMPAGGTPSCKSTICFK